MDTLTHFHSLEELIRALDRERKLLYGCFKIASVCHFVMT